MYRTGLHKYFVCKILIKYSEIYLFEQINCLHLNKLFHVLSILTSYENIFLDRILPALRSMLTFLICDNFNISIDFLLLVLCTVKVNMLWEVIELTSLLTPLILVYLKLILLYQCFKTFTKYLLLLDKCNFNVDAYKLFQTDYTWIR